MVSADLFATVEAIEGASLMLDVQIQNDVDDPDGLFLEADIDGTAGEMAVPVTLTRQRMEMRVYVDGVLVPELVHVRAGRSRGQNIQTGEFTVPIHRGASGYAGDWAGRGVTIRKSRIDIYGVYKTSTGYHEIPLIVNGIADNENREGSATDGYKVTYTVVDAGGRFDKETTDLILEPGSGLPRNRVVEIAARRCGVENISLETSDVAMMHEFQMADTGFIDPCQELADVEGRMIQWDRSGDLVWPRYGANSLLNSGSRWAFTERHFVLGSGKLTQPGELITEITVEGNAQKVLGACGDVTTTTVVTTKSLAARIAPLFAQSAGSSYSANPQPDPPDELQTVKVETFVTVLRCDILVYEKRTVQEWYNPEVARYEWNAATDLWDTLGSVYTDDDEDGDGPAYRYPVEVWATTEEDETWHPWLREGFQGPPATFLEFVPPGLDLGWGLQYPIGFDGAINGVGPEFTGGFHTGFEGVKIGSLTKSKRWVGVRQYVMTRDVTSLPYDEWWSAVTEPANGWTVLGNKESIVGDIEQFIETSQIIQQLGTDGNGFQTEEIEHSFGYSALPGPAFLYGDGLEYGQENETFRYNGSEGTTFSAGAGDQSHNEVETHTDRNGRQTFQEITNGLDSYLPSAERIPDSGMPRDADIYVDESEAAELYKKAYRTESVPISVTVTDLGLEANSTRGVHKLTSAYLESEDEAEWLARWMLEEGCAGVFTGELAGANWFVEPGDWCGTVRYRLIGVESQGRIEEVAWDWTPGQATNTSVTILLYEEG